jgi:NAD dependent epimerase/dehydratase family enzyme
MVLDSSGAAFKMLTNLFGKNLGSVLGDGKQWMSYISLNDLVGLVTESIQNESYSGVYNAVNNEPITNEYFSKKLAEELKVFLLPAAPKFLLKLALGEMSELVLSSQKVKSRAPYEFQDKNFVEFLKKQNLNS